MNGDVGVDPFLTYRSLPQEGVASSLSGKYVISCSPEGYAYLEHSDDDATPIKLFPGSSAGFYGSEVDLAAIADGSTLRILHLYRMETIATVAIRPHSLFVPPSGNSRHIGVVSQSGGAYLIDDTGRVNKTSLTVRPEYSVLWSSTVRPVGYTWSDDTVASLYLKSTKYDDGATIATPHGMVVFTIWSNPSLRRHEAYISTVDEPHVLKRMYSTPEGAEVEVVVEIDEGGTIDDLITLSDGRPAVVTGKVDGQVVTHLISPTSARAEYIQDVILDPVDLSSAECMGNSSIITWSQTPITPEYPSITDYAVLGHPTHRITGAHPHTPILPVTNTIKRVSGADGASIRYRYVSPLPDDGTYLADTVLLLVDEDGMVSAGAYSPTVRICYEESVPVAILPVIGGLSRTARVDDVCLDILDVVSDIVDGDVAREVVVMAMGRMCEAAVMALRNKKSKIRNVVLVDPDIPLVTGRRGRPITKVTVVTAGDFGEEGITMNSGVPTTTVSDDETVRILIQDYIR